MIWSWFTFGLFSIEGTLVRFVNLVCKVGIPSLLTGIKGFLRAKLVYVLAKLFIFGEFERFRAGF